VGDLEKNKECEGNARVHDHEYNDWYDCDIDEDECMVEETLLEKSYEEILHEVHTLYLNRLNMCSVTHLS